MSTKLGTVLANFTTNLATAIIVGGTSATLQSAVDDDGVALPSGRYFFTLDGSNSNKEHMSCDLVGTAISNIKSVSRQGVETVGLARAHRIGCTVTLTDFAHLLYQNNLLSGTTLFNSLVKLGYDADPAITSSDLNYFATVKFVNSVAIAGASNASTTVKGIVEMATLAELLAKTPTGGTGAVLAISPDIMGSTLLSDYKVDTGAANAYVITPIPAITAYVVGQIFSFKAVNANTGLSTLNVNALGVKTIKNATGGDLVANDILAGQIVVVEYEATTGFLQMISQSGNMFTAKGFRSATTIVDTSAATAPSTGKVLTATDSTHATWQTPAVPQSFLYTTTRGVNASSTETIPHGLGKIPSAVRVQGYSSAPLYFGNGAYNGTTTTGIWIKKDNASAGSSLSVGTFIDVGTYGSNPSPSGQAASVTFDATNIYIAWTLIGSGLSTTYFQLEVSA